MIVKAMNTHINNAKICENGCEVLWSIAYNNSKSIFSTKYPIYPLYKQPDDNRAIAGQARAIEAIVKAMNTHADNADVCIRGFEALRNITINGN